MGFGLGSFLKPITGAIGSALGDVAEVTKPIAETTGFFSNPNFISSLINAGTGLAGSYFGQESNKGLAEQYAQSQANQIAADKDLADKKLASDLEIAKLQAGASAGAAKRNTLANLYNNWANLNERGGEAMGQQALGTGKGITDAINARAAVLR